jgi:hypothetical protein
VNGEDWVLAHSYRGSGSGFKLREILLRQSPLATQGDASLYACVGVPNLEMDKIIYFAASVFWRAAVRTWRRDERTIKIDLGKYAEPLRLFLLGAGPFPDHMALHTWVSSLSGNILASLHLPEAKRIEGFRAYEFGIPGVCFRLLVARHMSPKWFEWSTAPGPHGLVGIVPDLDRHDVAHMAQRMNKLLA